MNTKGGLLRAGLTIVLIGPCLDGRTEATCRKGGGKGQNGSPRQDAPKREAHGDQGPKDGKDGKRTPSFQGVRQRETGKRGGKGYAPSGICSYVVREKN